MSRDEINVAFFFMALILRGSLLQCTRGVLLLGLRPLPMAPSRACCKQGS